MKKKYFFSLLELMICLALVSIIGSVFSLLIVKRIERERFYSDIKRFEKAVAFCFKIAKVREGDIEFKVYQTPIGVKYEIEQFSLPQEKNLISYAKMKNLQNKAVELLKIDFSPSGNIYPDFRIVFYSKKDKYKKEFDFKNSINTN